MHDARDPQALSELLRILQKDETRRGGEERPGARSSAVLPTSLGGCPSSQCKSEGHEMSEPHLSPLSAILRAPSDDTTLSGSVSSHSKDRLQTTALRATYDVWYEFHKLRYTIRIHRLCTLFSSLVASSLQSSSKRKPQSVVNIQEGPKDLDNFEFIGEEKIMTDGAWSSKASSIVSTMNSSESTAEGAQVKMGRSLRGGWRIRITNEAGNDTRFRVSLDLTSIGAVKDRAYRWSEDATGRVIARSGQGSSPLSRSQRRKPYMRFVCEEDEELDRSIVPQQTQDDLVACWTAWLWAERVLPTVNTGCSMESSKFRFLLSSVTVLTKSVSFFPSQPLT